MGLLGIYGLYKSAEEKSSRGKSSSSSASGSTVEQHSSVKSHTALSIIESNNTNSIDSYKSSLLYNFIKNMLKVDLQAFSTFKKLIDYSADVRRDYLARDNERLLALATYGDAFKHSFAAVENLGFRITEDEKELRYVYSDKSSPRGFSFSTCAKEIALNGISLTSEILLSGNNPYTERLEAFKKENPNAEQNLVEAQQLVEKLSKSKLALRISKNKRAMLAGAKHQLEEAQQTYKIEQGYVEDSKFYENLTNEQKSIINDYLLKREELEKSSVEQSAIETEISFINGIHYVFPSESEIAAFNNVNSSILTEAKQSLTPEDLQILENFFANTTEFLLSAPDEEIDKLSTDSSMLFETSFPIYFELQDIANEIHRRCSEQLQEAAETSGEEFTE